MPPSPHRPPSREETLALGGLFQLLGRLLCEELNPGLIDLLQAPDINAILIANHPNCAAYLARPWDECEFERAATEYCRLFVLPGGISPLAGAWVKKGDQSPGVGIDQLVRAVSSEIELPLPRSVETMPSEHGGRLLSIGGRLMCASDPGIASQGLTFLQATTIPWMKSFSQALSQVPESPFYPAIGHVLQSAYHQYFDSVPPRSV
ncbi:MAG: hypothetical protein AAF514_03255 [Verrucomicrobiota bacterium]